MSPYINGLRWHVAQQALRDAIAYRKQKLTELGPSKERMRQLDWIADYLRLLDLEKTIG